MYRNAIQTRRLIWGFGEHDLFKQSNCQIFQFDSNHERNVCVEQMNKSQIIQNNEWLNTKTKAISWSEWKLIVTEMRLTNKRVRVNNIDIIIDIQNSLRRY